MQKYNLSFTMLSILSILICLYTCTTARTIQEDIESSSINKLAFLALKKEILSSLELCKKDCVTHENRFEDEPSEKCRDCLDLNILDKDIPEFLQSHVTRPLFLKAFFSAFQEFIEKTF